MWSSAQLNVSTDLLIHRKTNEKEANVNVTHKYHIKNYMYLKLLEWLIGNTFLIYLHKTKSILFGTNRKTKKKNLEKMTGKSLVTELKLYLKCFMFKNNIGPVTFL